MYFIVSDGSNTIYASNRRKKDGSVFEKSGQPYNAVVLNEPSIPKNKNGSQIKITDTIIEIEAYDQDGDIIAANLNLSKASPLTIQAYINADEHDGLTSDIKVIDAKAIALSIDSELVVLRVKDEEPTAKVTTIAPDLKQIAGSDTFDDGRTYPIIYGTVYHATPLEMIKGSDFWIQGKVLKCYDNGREVSFNQSVGSYDFTVPNAPVGLLTVDVQYFAEASVAVGSATIGRDAQHARLFALGVDR